MTKKNNKIEEIDEKILLIFDSAVFPLSISEITKMLNEDFNLKVSPQIVKRELLKLKKERKIY